MLEAVRRTEAWAQGVDPDLTAMPDACFDIMPGSAKSRAASACITCTDERDIYEIARLARLLRARVAAENSRSGEEYLKQPRIRWFLPRVESQAYGGTGTWNNKGKDGGGIQGLGSLPARKGPPPSRHVERAPARRARTQSRRLVRTEGTSRTNKTREGHVNSFVARKKNS